MTTLNLGILAHVDAGKTSLTERLLHAAGVIETLGSVDRGSTRTDSLEIERRRGITIKAAVVSFPVDDVTVNLVDTPGHPDFIAEVERVLGVLDGAVLVVSAVEGVQAQTRVLMRTLRRLRIPTLLFVNKIDRSGAGTDCVLRAIAEKLRVATVPMVAVAAPGTREASVTPHGAQDTAFTERLTEVLAESDDALLAAYLVGAIPYRRLRDELAAQTARAVVHPVYFGSAITGAGVDELTAALTELLPAAGGDPHGQLSGTVFAIQRGPAGEKIAYIRLFSGTVRVRDRVPVGRSEARVTGVEVVDRGRNVRSDSLVAGRIGRLRGLVDARIGDAVGAPPAGDPGRQFAPPTLEAVVAPEDPADAAALHVALTELVEQDPLIDLRRDDLRREVSVSLYGEVQKEVVQAMLAEEYGIVVTFRATTTICIERPAGSGAAVEIIDVEPNPFLATVGLRVDPAPVGSGVDFRLEVELGSMPYAFMVAVEETLRQTLREGLHGWQVTDCTVTLIRSGYWARQSHAHGSFDKGMSSTAGDFRNLTPLVLMDALRRAGTTVCEPVHRFRLDVPADTVGSLAPVLARLRAVPGAPSMSGAFCQVDGEISAARVDELQRLLPRLTRGEGVLESAFARYEPVRGAVPTRRRTDHDPLHRREYLLRVLRRTGTRT